MFGGRYLQAADTGADASAEGFCEYDISTATYGGTAQYCSAYLCNAGHRANSNFLSQGQLDAGQPTGQVECTVNQCTCENGVRTH